MSHLLEYAPLLLRGAQETILVGLVSMAASIFWGLCLCLISVYGWSFLARCVRSYIIIVRAVPELVMLLIFYYGLSSLVQQTFEHFHYDVTLNLPPFWVGVLALSAIYGAFSAEVFRACLAQVPRGCIEAAHVLGLSRPTTFIYIMLPLMLRQAVPGLSNVWMVLIKATAIISFIQLPELMYSAELAARNTHMPFVFYLVACGLYLGITVFSLFIQFFFEKWVSIPHKGYHVSELF